MHASARHACIEIAGDMAIGNLRIEDHELYKESSSHNWVARNNADLERFQEKWNPVFCPKMRAKKAGENSCFMET
jgi:hypothetical protein